MNLNGATFSATVDSAGKWHNDYLSYLLNQMQAKNIALENDTIQRFLKITTSTFFATKGITIQNTSIQNLDLSDTTWNTTSFSPEAQTILTQLKSLVNNYDESQHSSFISQCETLKSNALYLSIDKEALTVGTAISVAINSFTYWKDNETLWQNYLAPTNNVLTRSAPCNVKLKELGGADIAGAINGVIGGGIGAGVAGAVAGGILVSAASSSYNILGQVAQCMPGTVGTVSRWLADWF